MRVKTIRAAGRADVYNMEVEDTHDFAIAEGVIVHNCYDQVRYVAMENPIAPEPAKQILERGYNPLDTDPAAYGRYDYYIQS